MTENKLIRKKHKALNNGNKEQLISVCVDLAELYFKEGQYENSINEYKTVADTYKKLGKQIDYARANRMIGEAYTHLQEYDKALKHQQIHLDIAKQENNKLEQQRALATIGHTNLTKYLDTKDKNGLDLAYKSFKKSLNVCESLTDVSKHERMDMSARLFANLGVIQECFGKYNEGIELVQRSINICKENDIYEQLQRGYTFLGALYVRIEEYSKAIYQYNLAIEVAKRLQDKKSLISASLAAKADVLIKLGDFQRAKHVLLKAYKLKNSDPVDQQSIIHNLKVVAAICKAQKSLLSITENDFVTQKKLYEKMGDGACEVKNYKIAIEYYQKMLEAAKKNGEMGNELSPCYVSLAQTYSDNEEYDLALKYFRIEYDLSKENLKECLGTLFSIADTLEAACKPFNEIQNVYIEAMDKCQDIGDVELEKKVLSRYSGVLKKFNQYNEAELVDQRLDDIGYVAGETESEASEHTPHLGDDISIDNITDISDPSDSDLEEELKPRSTSKKSKSISFKLNSKGETPLHKACIKGNLPLVQHLIEQGHLINVRDNCGWLPIHEACNHGHYEIVRFLIQKGARVTDRGGKGCDGITPLHDAACNGNLEIVQLLLDNGASPIAKTDEGKTALELLKSWRINCGIDHDKQILYDKIVGQMMQALEKSGYSKMKDEEDIEARTTSPSTSRSLSLSGSLSNSRSYSISESPSKSKLTLRNQRTSIGRMRRRISDSSSSGEDTLVEQSSTSATKEYRKAMNNLRFSTLNDSFAKKRKLQQEEKKPALLESTSVVDNWLENDLESSNQKRRRTASLDLFNTTTMRGTSTSNSNRSSNDTFIDLDETLTPKKDILKNSRKIQTSLMRAGFESTKRKSDSIVTKNASPSPGKCSRNSLPHTSQEIIPITQETKTSTQLIASTVPVDIRIESRLYRVPIRLDDINTLTIKWLAEEAAKRYCKKEGMKPKLELESQNGAILADSDTISMLFPCGRLQPEELQAKILSWNSQSLSERYEEACHNANEKMDERITITLQMASRTVDLSDKNLRNRLLPLLTALQRYKNLIHLNLSGNYMKDQSTEPLCNALITLENLVTLNLSLNHLTCESLKRLSTIIEEQSSLRYLTHLDFSYNELGDESLSHLGIMTRYLKLEVLILIDVGFTSNIFKIQNNSNVELCLDYLKRFDLSENALDKDDIIKMLQFVKARNLEYLNVSNNKLTSEGLAWEIVNYFEGSDSICTNLEELNLSRCLITDPEVYELLRLIINKKLNVLNLSYNQRITALSLRRIIENSNLISSINLVGCYNLLKDAKLDCNLHEENKLKEVFLSTDTYTYANECNMLINKFKRMYFNNCNVNKTDNMLEIKIK